MRSAEETDEALIARAGRGDRLAASELVVRHADRVFASAWRMLGERAAAEDVTQETFLKLWAQAPRWRSGGAAPKTWLYRVSMNACIDRLRRRRSEAPEDAALEIIDGAPDAETALIASERVCALRAALQDLPERQRVAITLCHYEGLKNFEAAAAMETSVEAVESLLARGKRALRAALDAHLGDEGESRERAAI